MCRTGCREGNHASWGECARAANVTVSGDTTVKHQKDLNDYAYARSIGLQPETSSGADARKALREAGA